MAAVIAFENGRISKFEGLVTLILTLDQVTLHTVVHQSSISTYTPNFIEIEETFSGRTDIRTYCMCVRRYVRMYARTDGQTDGHLRLVLLGRLCQRVDLAMTTK